MNIRLTRKMLVVTSRSRCRSTRNVNGGTVTRTQASSAASTEARSSPSKPHSPTPNARSMNALRVGVTRSRRGELHEEIDRLISAPVDRLAAGRACYRAYRFDLVFEARHRGSNFQCWLVPLRRCASTCRRAIGAMPTGRRRASGGMPARLAATHQHLLSVRPKTS